MQARIFLMLLIAIAAIVALALQNPVPESSGVITGGEGYDLISSPIEDDLTEDQ